MYTHVHIYTDIHTENIVKVQTILLNLNIGMFLSHQFIKIKVLYIFKIKMLYKNFFYIEKGFIYKGHSRSPCHNFSLE